MPLLTSEELSDMAPVFRGKVGQGLARTLIHWLNVDELNSLYDRYADLEGPDFAAAVLKDLGMDIMAGFGNGYEGELKDYLPSGPFITISNHPCGHVDGVSLVDLFGRIRPDYKVMVNQILARVKNLDANFISVTPVGKERTGPTAASISGVKAALHHLRSGGVLGLFPSGAVSDLSLKDGCIRDRQWQDPVIRLIRKAAVPVVPVRFFDGNSPFYYSLGLIDWRVRLLRLPSELFNKNGNPFRIGIGPVISPQQQEGFGTDIEAFSAFLRSAVYDMQMPDAFHLIV